MQLVLITSDRADRRSGDGCRAFFRRKFEGLRCLRRVVASLPSGLTIGVQNARLSGTREPWPEGWLRIGDAAAPADPLSGQGWSRALRSAHRAASVLSRYLHDGKLDVLWELEHEAAQSFSKHRSERDALLHSSGEGASNRAA